MNKLDRFKGCLFGLAVGDAVGTTLEFQDRGYFTPITDMVGGGPFNLQSGMWTDDTSMALCLGQSLIDKGFDATDQMEKYIKWWQDGYMSVTGMCFDIGTTTKEALRSYDGINPYQGSIDKYDSGNGGIMRIAPIAMYFHDYQEAIKHAALSSRVTHGSQSCIECAELLVKYLHNCLHQKVDGFEIFNDRNSIERFKSLRFITKNKDDIKGSGYVVESLEAALWCFYNTYSFREAVLMAANLGDDADTTAAITGQIAGAYYGYDNIPKEWIDKLYMKDLIEDIVVKLYNHSENING